MTESGTSAADEIANLQPTANPGEVAEADDTPPTYDVDADEVDTRNDDLSGPVDDVDAVDAAAI